ncbi:MAG TPA: hypothetical protein VFO55_13440 [Gemmatimonadaceae bacterium]|nr:hypothetical protein [Gemmatimonadaceae bacterium]
MSARCVRAGAAVLAFLVPGCAGESRPAVDSMAGTEHTATQSEPLFEVDIWPGEGIPVIEAVRDSLPLLGAPRIGAPVTGTLTVRRGQPIEYDSSRYQTLAGVEVRVRAPTTISGSRIGPVRFLSIARYYSGADKDTVFDVAPSTAVELLQYRAEGTCFIRIDGDVVNAEACPTFDTTRFASSGEPRTLWWIRVRGQSATGWLLLSDSTARAVRRTF